MPNAASKKPQPASSLNIWQLVVGLGMILLALAFVVIFPNANGADVYLRMMASLGSGLVAMSITGSIEVHFPNTRVLPGIRAAGAIAIVVLFFLVDPPGRLKLELQQGKARFVQPPPGVHLVQNPFGTLNVEALIPSDMAASFTHPQFSYDCYSQTPSWVPFPVGAAPSENRDSRGDLWLSASLPLSNLKSGAGHAVDLGNVCQLQLTFDTNGQQERIESSFKYGSPR